MASSNIRKTSGVNILDDSEVVRFQLTTAVDGSDSQARRARSSSTVEHTSEYSSAVHDPV